MTNEKRALLVLLGRIADRVEKRAFALGGGGMAGGMGGGMGVAGSPMGHMNPAYGNRALRFAPSPLKQVTPNVTNATPDALGNMAQQAHQANAQAKIAAVAIKTACARIVARAVVSAMQKRADLQFPPSPTAMPGPITGGGPPAAAPPAPGAPPAAAPAPMPPQQGGAPLDPSAGGPVPGAAPSGAAPGGAPPVPFDPSQAPPPAMPQQSQQPQPIDTGMSNALGSLLSAGDAVGDVGDQHSDISFAKAVTAFDLNSGFWKSAGPMDVLKGFGGGLKSFANGAGAVAKPAINAVANGIKPVAKQMATNAAVGASVGGAAGVVNGYMNNPANTTVGQRLTNAATQGLASGAAGAGVGVISATPGLRNTGTGAGIGWGVDQLAHAANLYQGNYGMATGAALGGATSIAGGAKNVYNTIKGVPAQAPAAVIKSSPMATRAAATAAVAIPTAAGAYANSNAMIDTQRRGGVPDGQATQDPSMMSKLWEGTKQKAMGLVVSPEDQELYKSVAPVIHTPEGQQLMATFSTNGKIDPAKIKGAAEMTPLIGAIQGINSKDPAIAQQSVDTLIKSPTIQKALSNPQVTNAVIDQKMSGLPDGIRNMIKSVASGQPLGQSMSGMADQIGNSLVNPLLSMLGADSSGLGGLSGITKLLMVLGVGLAGGGVMAGLTGGGTGSALGGGGLITLMMMAPAMMQMMQGGQQPAAAPPQPQPYTGPMARPQ